MRYLLLFLLVALLAGCKQNYVSPVKSPVTGYLVIEGAANSGSGGTTIKLSRTSKLDSATMLYETGAAVSVEGEDNSVFNLADKGQGNYTADTLGLHAGVKYRLHIRVSTGKEYLSDYVPVNNNPPIDSVSWKQGSDGVQMNINTHDPQNNTRYYQWSYDETWQIQSAYYVYLKYKITPQPPDELIYSAVYRDSTFSYDPSIVTCWQFNSSSSLLLGSTVKLTSDIVNLPLLSIPHASIKLGILYSVKVKQYSWTKEGYEFLEKMKKNTELTGSIFDAQPSELKGNIRCTTDANETVIGFFNVCPVREQRIFISNSQLPGWRYFDDCFAVELRNDSDTIKIKGLSLVPTTVGKKDPMGGGIFTFFAAPKICTDCTLRGTNVKPAYWP